MNKDQVQLSKLVFTNNWEDLLRDLNVLKDKIKKNGTLSRTLYDNDRPFVYGKVTAYTVHKQITQRQ